MFLNITPTFLVPALLACITSVTEGTFRGTVRTDIVDVRKLAMNGRCAGFGMNENGCKGKPGCEYMSSSMMCGLQSCDKYEMQANMGWQMMCQKTWTGCKVELNMCILKGGSINPPEGVDCTQNQKMCGMTNKQCMQMNRMNCKKLENCSYERSNGPKSNKVCLPKESVDPVDPEEPPDVPAPIDCTLYDGDKEECKEKEDECDWVNNEDLCIPKPPFECKQYNGNEKMCKDEADEFHGKDECDYNEKKKRCSAKTTEEPPAVPIDCAVSGVGKKLQCDEKEDDCQWQMEDKECIPKQIEVAPVPAPTRPEPTPEVPYDVGLMLCRQHNEKETDCMDEDHGCVYLTNTKCKPECDHYDKDEDVCTNGPRCVYKPNNSVGNRCNPQPTCELYNEEQSKCNSLITWCVYDPNTFVCSNRLGDKALCEQHNDKVTECQEEDHGCVFTPTLGSKGTCNRSCDHFDGDEIKCNKVWNNCVYDDNDKCVPIDEPVSSLEGET